MSEAASLDDWMSAAVTSAEELATVALGFDGATFVGKRDTMPLNVKSAVVALIGDTASVQLAFAATESGCQQLARALLSMEPDEDDLPEDDMVDAVSEVVNIMAGQVKRIVGGADSTMKMGLPLFVHGKFEGADDVETAIADINIGPVSVILLILKNQIV